MSWWPWSKKRDCPTQNGQTGNENTAFETSAFENPAFEPKRPRKETYEWEGEAISDFNRAIIQIDGEKYTIYLIDNNNKVTSKIVTYDFANIAESLKMEGLETYISDSD